MKKSTQKKPRVTLWSILTGVCAILMVAAFVATYMANYYARSVNMYLNIETYEVVSSGSDEDTTYYASAYDSEEELAAADKETCEEVEAEGAVLLMNDGILPLAAGTTVSTFSHSSVDPIYGGTGSGDVSVSDSTPTLASALTDAGLAVNEQLWEFYSSGNGSGETYTRVNPSLTDSSQSNMVLNEVPWSVIEAEDGLVASFVGTTAVVTISRVGGESYDLTDGSGNFTTATALVTNFLDADGNLANEDGDYLDLADQEAEILMELKALKDAGEIDGIIVLINSSNAMEMAFLENEDYGIDAALWIGSVGECGLNAVGDILAGNVNPSGKLVDTYAYSNQTTPAMQNAGYFTYSNLSDYSDITNACEQYYVVYQEGIYIGYLYYETRYEDTVMGTGNAGDYDYASDVAYPFGYGLSYTTFEKSDMQVTETDETFIVSVTVTNTGDVAGKDVVEVYLQSPYTEYDKENGIEKASVTLCGYAKTSELAPGTSETVTVEVDKSDMASYDSNNAMTYILDAGDYYLAVGDDAHDALNNILAAKGYTTADGMTDDGNSSLTWRTTVDALDTETYSVSSHTGAEITNQFDDADLNKFEDGAQSITYLTRSDWVGTFPSAVSLGMTDALEEALKSYQTYEVDADAEMPTFGAENGLTLAAMIGLDYDDEAWDTLLDQITVDEAINLVANGMHTTAAVASIGKPQTADENGPVGLNQSFFGGSITSTAYPSAVVIASTWNVDLITKVGEQIGEDGLACGVSGLYGPAINIHRTPYSGRNFEYYSEDSFLSATTVKAFTQGVQSKGMYVYIKHLVLCDQESMRVGNSIWTNEQALRELYLEPFESALSCDEGNAHACMTAHDRIGATWCGDSTNLLNNVLREEWGFDGFVITDMDAGGVNALMPTMDTTFMTATTAVTSGTDCFDAGVPAVRIAELTAASDDATVMSAVRESCHRILYVVANSAAMNGFSASDSIRIITPWWEYAIIALDVVVVALTAGSTYMLVKAVKRKKAIKPGANS